MEPFPHPLTQLLHQWSAGDQSALEKIIPVVHDELHRLARRCMADERPGHTLQPTALVNEAVLVQTLDFKQFQAKVFVL
jgi:hypothetical protein